MDSKSPDALLEATAPVFQLMDRELWLLTTDSEKGRGGLICTFVSKASIVPELPRMAVGLAKHHHTCGLVQSSERFTLHLLWPDQIDLVWRFGLSSGRDKDKFAGMEVQTSPLGNPLLGTCLAWLDCRVEATLDLGDRILFAAEVTDGASHGNNVPLSVNRLYHEAADDKYETLGRMYDHDSEEDAKAIQAWRRR